MKQQPGRLGFGVIGAGKVGPVLALALAGAGHQLIGIHARSERGRDRAEALLPRANFLSLEEICERSELLILAIPPEEIAPLAVELAERGLWHSGQLVVHTAAEFGTGVLTPAIEAGVIALAIHPALEFTGSSLDLARLRQSWCAVTAAAPLLPIAQALTVELGAEPVVIAEEDRVIYAEAIGVSSEFSKAIVQQSKNLLSSIGVEQPSLVLSQLLHSAVDRALGGIPEGSTSLPPESDLH